MLNGDFDDYMERTVIANCDVEIYNYYRPITGETFSLTKFFDKNNLESFSMRKSNKGICETMPYDNVSFTVLNWSSVSDTTKKYFLENTGYTCFVVRFVIENEQTANGYVYLVKRCEVDEKRNKATIIGESFYNAQVGKNNLLELTIYGKLTVPQEIETLPYRASMAEYIQHIAIGLGKGTRKTKFDFSNVGLISDEYADLSLGCDLALAEKNIYDYKKSIEEEDRSNITYYGMVSSGAEKNLGSEYIDVTTGFQRPSITKSWNYQVAITRFTVTRTNPSGTVTSQFTKDNAIGIALATDLHLSFVGGVTWNASGYATSGARYTANFYGYDNLSFSVPDNNQYYIKCQSLMNSSGQLQTAQANARAYYSHRDYYECECRIDPRIEPLDKIYINEVGIVAVEEVEVNFNGGFKGKLKGRIVDGIIKPVYVEDYGDSDFDTIKVVNPNTYAVRANVFLSTGETQAYVIQANNYVTIWADEDNRPMRTEKSKMMSGTLTQDVYMTTSMYDVPSAVNDTHVGIYFVLNPPVITRNVYNGTGQFAVDVYNPNNCDAKLRVKYSGGTLEFDIPANSTITLRQENAGELTDSASQKAYGDLQDTVDCQFTHLYPYDPDYGEGYTQATRWTVIWEDDI